MSRRCSLRYLLAFGFVATASASTCITQADVDTSQAAWDGALESIGQAWTGSDPHKNAQDCVAAKSAAEGALSAAYAYDSSITSKVLFKPTLTSGAYTFRNDRAGALSYFVGECAGSGHIKQDGGFALGYSVGTQGDRSTYMGFENVRFHEMSYQISENTDSPFCRSAIAQGKMTITSRLTGDEITVDKTFAYVKNPNPDGAPLLLTAHHSSLEISAAASHDKVDAAYIMAIVAICIAGVTVFILVIIVLCACIQSKKGAELPSAAPPSAAPSKADDRV